MSLGFSYIAHPDEQPHFYHRELGVFFELIDFKGLLRFPITA
jgi:hypothetical protein